MSEKFWRLFQRDKDEILVNKIKIGERMYEVLGYYHPVVPRGKKRPSPNKKKLVIKNIVPEGGDPEIHHGNIIIIDWPWNPLSTNMEKVSFFINETRQAIG